jgi:hypothetical protein
MTVGSVKTNNGRKVLLNRYGLSVPDYTAPTSGIVGINGVTPNKTDTSLTFEIPISYLNILNPCTASLIAGDSGTNSSSSTSIYKIGFGQTDNTGQHLIKTSTASNIVSYNIPFSNNLSTANYFGCWIYFSAAGLAVLDITTACEIRVGSSTATDYYEVTKAASYFNVGWNWISQFTASATLVGTPTTINKGLLIMNTTTATDTFNTANIITDCWGQFDSGDLTNVLTSITCDENLLQNTYVFTLASSDAVGFPISQVGIKNNDTNKLLLDLATHDEEEKSDNNIIVYSFIDRIL